MYSPMNGPTFSFWETQTYFREIDLVVIGSGIVGLNAAISFKEKEPAAKVLVLERGMLPSGASTKNAGFACFGSASELLSDLQHSPQDHVWQTVEMRVEGLKLLRKRLGDRHIGFHRYGGFELFDSQLKLEHCASNLDILNRQLRPLFGKDVYKMAGNYVKTFGFKGINGMILNTEEGQIDTGRMMDGLIRLASQRGIYLLNGLGANALEDTQTGVRIYTPAGEICCRHLVVATNGFASELLGLDDVKPARAQVLVTKPIPDLKLKGTFHYDEGFYYFRNIGNRVLFGGGRNLDFETETTTVKELNPMIQARLDEMLTGMILPGKPVEVEQRWAGIMGVGQEKKPIIRKTGPNTVCAVRMGGMGVAIGSLVGKMAIDMLMSDKT